MYSMLQFPIKKYALAEPMQYRELHAETRPLYAHLLCSHHRLLRYPALIALRCDLATSLLEDILFPLLRIPDLLRQLRVSRTSLLLLL